MSSNLSEEALHSVNILRALLVMQKNAVTIPFLLKEYREMEGKMLPFKSMGFKTVEQLLRASGEFLLINDRGETFVSAKPNKDSAHITNMVKKQRSERKRSRRSGSATSNWRMPAKTDQSWNKSSYSSNVYRNLSKGNSRSQRSTTNSRIGDSNNNNSLNNNRNLTNTEAIRNMNANMALNMVNSSQSGSIPIQDVRARLNVAKPPPIELREKINAGKSSDLREKINTEKPDLRQKLNATKIERENSEQKPDLRERLNSKKEQNNLQTNQLNQINKQLNGNLKAAEVIDLTISSSDNESMKSTKPINTSSKLGNRLESIRNARNISLKKDEIQIKPEPTQTKSNQTSETQIKNVRSQSIKSDEGSIKSEKVQSRLYQTFEQPKRLNRLNSSIQERLKIMPINDSTEATINSPTEISPCDTPYSPTIKKYFQNSFPNTNEVKNKNSAVIKEKVTNETIKILSPNERYTFDASLNSIIQLANYCAARGYPEPEYHVMQPKFAYKKHVCSVTINNENYSTYPKYFNDPEIAKAACAAIAIQEIKVIEANIVCYPVCTDSDLDLLMKIYQELKVNHPNGIFMKMFPKVFESTFQQCLPEKWYLLVEKSKLFILEQTIDNQNTIIFANLDVNESDGMDLDEMIIDPLILPWDSKYWNLYITHCASTVEIWARIVDKEYSQQLDSLLTDIEIAMLTDKQRPGSLSTGQMYLVCISECWHRIRLERMDKANGKCLCFFIDFGDDDWISMDQLFVCDKKFLKLPPQAVPFSLFGLEDFAENPVANQHLNEMLMGKTLIAQIFTKKETYEGKTSSNKSSSSSINGSTESLNEIIKIQAVLYDTSSNVDVCLNPILINKICDDTPGPELKQTSPTNVKITHISEYGDVYLQVLDTGLNYVQTLISQLVESKFQRDQYKVNPQDIKLNNLYLIHDVDTNRWYRGCIAENNIENPGAAQFKIFYVDHGMTKLVNVSNIFRLESLSAALSRFPRQGIKTKMYNLPPLSEFILKRMKEMLPADCLAIVKLAFNKLDTSKNVVPQIIVFIRVDRNQSLCNVNDAIRMEYELISNDLTPDVMKLTSFSDSNSACSSPTSPQPKSLTELTPAAQSLTTRSPITIPSSPTKGNMLKLSRDMKLPKIGDLYNVLVTIASNPFNFFIRPYDDFLPFQNMMAELQEHCYENDEFILEDSLEVGEAYAVLLDDDIFYRCIVERILPDHMCLVYFCDCGDRNVVELNKLRTLPTKCRELPTQAIQAKLHGVKPIKGHWSSEDSIRFSELVVGKRFATVVNNISIDDFDPQKSKVLELTVIDVSTSQDVYINKILVEENRAILA